MIQRAQNMKSLHAVIHAMLALVLVVGLNRDTGASNPENKSRTGHWATPASKATETTGTFLDHLHTLISGSPNTSSGTPDSSALAGKQLTEAADGATQGREDGQEITSGEPTDNAVTKTVSQVSIQGSLSTPNETRAIVDLVEQQNGTENIPGPAQHQNGTENTRGLSEHQQEKIVADGIASIPAEQTTVSERTSSESAPDNYIDLTSETVTECLNSGEAKSYLTFFCLAGSISFETPVYIDAGFKLNGDVRYRQCKILLRVPPSMVLQLHVSTVQLDCDSCRFHLYTNEDTLENYLDLRETRKESTDIVIPMNFVELTLEVFTQIQKPASVLLNFTAILPPDKPQLELTYTSPKKGGCKIQDLFYMYMKEGVSVLFLILFGALTKPLRSLPLPLHSV